MSKSILNNAITCYFNDIIGRIKNPELLGLKPGERPLKQVKCLNYNSNTETVYIEMDNLVYLLTLENGQLFLNEYEKAGETQ